MHSRTAVAVVGLLLVLVLVPGCSSKKAEMAQAPVEETSARDQDTAAPVEDAAGGAAEESFESRTDEAAVELGVPLESPLEQPAAEPMAEPPMLDSATEPADAPYAERSMKTRPRTYKLPRAAKETAPAGELITSDESDAEMDAASDKGTDDDAAESTAQDDADFSVVKVFYGTDRVSIVPSLITAQDIFRNFTATLVTAGCGLLLLVGARLFRSRRWMLGIGGTLLVAIALFLGFERLGQLSRMRAAAQRNSEFYTADAGELQYGTADVSIPKTHRMGEIERPSVFRLEFKEDPAEHVVILNALPCSETRFFQELRTKVEQSPRRELFVFIHGYNVTFEHAVRRTAQVAFDMDFEGAPVTYSWPSQGSLLAYSTDEESVRLTVAHLKTFLNNIRLHSGAESINLVAHSMGNRALTQVLKEYAQTTTEPVPQPRMFNEVVFAAPDVSAAEFVQMAPSFPKVANRLTLYASSNDKALLASKKVHGFHRAGEAGERLVVVNGVETIDVSEIDLSILGHNYIGSSEPIIHDLKHLMLMRYAPEQRTWLRPASLATGLEYWVYPGVTAIP